MAYRKGGPTRWVRNPTHPAAVLCYLLLGRAEGLRLPGTAIDLGTVIYLPRPAPVLRAIPPTNEPEGEAALVAAANRAVAEAYAALCEVEMRLREVTDAIQMAKRGIEDWPQPPQPGPE